MKASYMMTPFFVNNTSEGKLVRLDLTKGKDKLKKIKGSSCKVNKMAMLHRNNFILNLMYEIFIMTQYNLPANGPFFLFCRNKYYSYRLLVKLWYVLL